MKLFKSLLLASATGMVAVSGASAADLGVKKPSPVEYVRACYNPLWGTSGGFVIPGTQTCLRVGGQVRFDIGYSQNFGRNDQVLGYRGGGNIFLDAITASEYGNVRAFVNMSMIYRTGTQRTGTGFRWGQTIDAGPLAIGGTFGQLGNAAGTDFSGSSAFIQFAGFTFGRTASFFGALGIPPTIIATQFAPGVGNINQVAYTAVLGNGFLATIALEDPTTRRNGIGILNGSNPVTAGIVSQPAIVGNFVTGPLPLNMSSNRMPTFTAALRLDQAWGSAELSGVVQEIRPAGLSSGFPVGAIFIPSTGAGVTSAGVAVPAVSTNATTFASTKYGFGIAGGLKINTPFIAAGDALYLQGTYADGIVSAITGNYFYGSLLGSNNGGVRVNTFDAVVDPISGSLKTTKSFGVTAGFQHFWTPTIASSLSGSYGEINTAGLSNGIGDFKLWGVGLLNTWTPVRGLTFALDAAYIYVDPKGRVTDLNSTAGIGSFGTGLTLPGATAFTKSGDGQWLGRFRVVRDF